MTVDHDGPGMIIGDEAVLDNDGAAGSFGDIA